MFTKLASAAEASPQQNASLIDVWKSACAVGDLRTLLRTFDTVQDAIDRFEASLPLLDDQGPEARRALGELVSGMRAWLDINSLRSSAGPFLQKTSRLHLMSLLYVEHGLDRLSPEMSLQQSALDAIGEKLKELEEVVTDQEVPERLRAMLHNLVGRMRWAVANYNLIGVDGLVREMNAAALTLVHLARLDNIDPAKPPNWFAKTLGVVETVAERCRKALAVYKTAKDGIDVVKDVTALLS